MRANPQIFGARARVKIIFSGDLAQLAEKLRLALTLNVFEIQNSEYPPYEPIASAESMGWEAWLRTSSTSEANCFILEMETEDSFLEIAHGKAYDLSPWLARFVTTLCDLNAVPDN